MVLAGMGDKQAQRRIAEMDLATAPTHPEFVVQRAVALAGAHDQQALLALVEALARTTDPDFRCRLFVAVAPLSGDEPRQILLSAYDDVKTRRCVAVALERRADPKTASFVAEKLENEPYTHVRAVLIRVLAKVGGEHYRDHIQRIGTSDSDPLVSEAARSALHDVNIANTSVTTRRRGSGRPHL